MKRDKCRGWRRRKRLGMSHQPDLSQGEKNPGVAVAALQRERGTDLRRKREISRPLGLGELINYLYP